MRLLLGDSKTHTCFYVKRLTPSSLQPRARHRCVVRCAEPDRDRGNVGSAQPFVPPTAPPPAFIPPPPPPPPPGVVLSDFPQFSRRSLLAIIAGGSLVSVLSNVLDEKSRSPTWMEPIYNSDLDAWLVMNNSGQQLAIREDNRGRYYVLDQAGNIYYDTQDEQTGWTVVTRDDEVWNVMYNEDTRSTERTRVGSLDQLVEVPLDQVSDVANLDMDSEAMRELMEFKQDSLVFFDDTRNPKPYPLEAGVGVAPEEFGKDPKTGEYRWFGRVATNPALTEVEAELDEVNGATPSTDVTDLSQPDPLSFQEILSKASPGKAVPREVPSGRIPEALMRGVIELDDLMPLGSRLSGQW